MSADDSTLISPGTVLVDRPILQTLEHLWEGHVEPSDLARIELGIRAFLTSPRLVVSHHAVDHLNWRAAFSDEVVILEPSLYEPPFHDHLLDYEFIHPDEPLSVSGLPPTEKSYLTEFVRRRMEDEVRRILPKCLRVEGEAVSFLYAWYRGRSLRDCETAAKEPEEWWPDCDNPFDLDKFIAEGKHEILHNGPAFEAAYFVGCHRAGMVIYTDSPLGRICNEFIFSEWPNKLFERLDSEHRSAMRQIRGPGIAVDLPPLTALLLSRASNRHYIPSALCELREEYEAGRNDLWAILGELWEAPVLADQIKHLRKLQGAAESIFSAAFPERFNVLSLGLNLAQVSAGGVARVAQQLLERDMPRSRVCAVSLAAKLSKDLRKTLLNSKDILRRHFSPSELRDFGIG